MTSQTIDRPRLDNSPPIDMPPLNIVKCQCPESCPMSGPCELEATGDDLLCTECRRALERIAAYKAGIFSQAMSPLVAVLARRSVAHCHQCDPEFDKEEDDNASN